jgi:hypothetical protein
VTTQQAKQTLLAFRPWAKDSQDLEVVEALALCRQDAELAQWFENHCAVQNAIHARFNQVAVPEGLKEQILSESKVRILVWWRRPAALAVAAALAFFIAISSLWLTLPRSSEKDVSFAAYRSRMIRTAVRAYGMDLETNDVAQIRAYLAQHQAHADYALPRKLDPNSSVGCGVLSWQGRPVTMVCFRTGKPLAPGAKSDLFLFVIDQKDLANPPPLNTPAFATVSTLVTASWSEDGKVYMLAASEESDLRQRLQPN